jgi:hypothetical protein
MRFAIYVRKGEETYDAVDQVPEQLRMRKLALRSFDRDAMMLGWELVDLANFRVKLKAEFQASNRDLYKPEAVLMRSAINAPSKER